MMVNVVVFIAKMGQLWSGFRQVLAEVGKAAAGYVLEEFAEVRHIIEAKAIGDLFHADVGISRLSLAFQYDTLLYMVAGRETRHFFHHFIEVIGSNRQF